LAAAVDEQQAVGGEAVRCADNGMRSGYGAVMRQGTVGIESGDGGKTGGDEARLACALGGEAFVDRDFGDLLAPEGGFKPGIKSSHRSTIACHGFTHPLSFGGGFACFGQHAGVGGLNHSDAGGHGLA